MEYRRLGKSGLKVSALSFGSWLTFANQIENSTADELMGIAYDAGVNFFDNAENYADGKAEIVMGKILKDKRWDRSSFLISSKVFFGALHKGINQVGLSRKHVIEGCNASLKRLQLDYLDMFFCHRPDKETPIEETVLAMNILLQQGKILYWGTSEWSAVEIEEAVQIAKDYRLIGPTMEQPQYNLLVRNKVENELTPVFDKYGLGATVWSPLASGILSGKYINHDVENTRLSMQGMDWLKNRTLAEDRMFKTIRLNEIASALNIPLPLFSIAWCLKNPRVSTVILGASNSKQLQQNLLALDYVEKLDDNTMCKIDELLKE